MSPTRVDYTLLNRALAYILTASLAYLTSGHSTSKSSKIKLLSLLTA